MKISNVCNHFSKEIFQLFLLSSFSVCTFNNLFDYGKKALRNIYPIANSYGGSEETLDNRITVRLKDAVCFDNVIMMTTLSLIISVHVVVTVLMTLY